MAEVAEAAARGERRSARQVGELDYVPAGHVERALAFAIDVVITGAQMLILTFAVGAFDLDRDAFVRTLLGLAIWIPGLGYFPYFWVRNAQTPGMMPFGQRVVRSDDLGEIGIGRALLRLAALVIAIVSVVGILWTLVDPKRRGLHDRVAGTLVISG